MLLLNILRSTSMVSLAVWQVAPSCLKPQLVTIAQMNNNRSYECIEHVSISFSIDCLCKAFCLFKELWANYAVAHNFAPHIRVVDGERYRRMLNTFQRPVVIHLRNRHELWFQQDGTTCHTANETMDVLQVMFGNNISRRAALTWLPRSPDLNVLDYYLWGYLKERFYINKPENLEDLKDAIRRKILTISPATLRSVMNNALVRARSCIAVEG